MREFRMPFCVLFLVTAVCFVLCMLGSGAERETVSPYAVLSGILSVEVDCPVGTVYHSAAAEGEEGYFSSSLCATLYGDGDLPAEWASVEDFAIFLSATESPTELAVFLTPTRADAEEVAELCVERLGVLQRYYRGSDLEAYAAGGRVVVLGRYVVMVISSDSDAALSEARAVLKRHRDYSPISS